MSHIPIISHAILRSRELPLAFKTKRSFMLRGRPGVGKTEAIRQFAADQKIGYIDSRVLYFDPTDIKGFPALDKKNGSFEWLPPAEFPLVGNKNVPEEGIWVFEELPSAAPAVQGALFQVINERRIGQREVKPGWLMLATGNRLEDKAVVNKMPSPMVSRLRHLQLEVTVPEWADYALNHGVMPELIAFFRFRPDLLNSFDPAKWVQDTPYCCPRTASFLSETILALPPKEQANPPLDILTGWIGAGVGAELKAFLDICASLPSWDTICRDPAGFDLPSKPSHLYALGALVSRNADAKNTKEVFAILNRKDLPGEHMMHIITSIVNSKAPHSSAISQSPEFVKWGANNAALFGSLTGVVR